MLADWHLRVRTLTGKEIELDIESDYKVQRHSQLTNLSHNLLIYTGCTNKREGWGERRHPTCAAAFDLRRETNVHLTFPSTPPRLILPRQICAMSAISHGTAIFQYSFETRNCWCHSLRRVDDKTASEYNLEGGATLHLVLALRGGI